MKFFHLIEGVFVKLSVIPGLGFLHEYVHELETSNTRRKQQVDKYRGYARALRETGDDVRHGGHHEHDEHGGHENNAKHGKKGKKGKIARRAAPPSRRGQAARPSKEKQDHPEGLEDDYYEDDDFESYLQH